MHAAPHSAPLIPSDDRPEGLTQPAWLVQERLLLSAVLRLVGKSLAPEVAIHEMLHLMSELLGLNRGRLVLVDGYERALDGPLDRHEDARIWDAYGLTRTEVAQGRYRRGEGITGSVWALGRSTIIPDVDAEPRFLFRAVARNVLPAETVSFLATPVNIDGHRVGVLACHRLRQRPRALSDDLALLEMLATLVGQVLKLYLLVQRSTGALEAENAELQEALKTASARYDIVGEAPALLRAIRELERVSASNATVMLLGESGTGKELFARAVHLASPRRDRAFIKVNCAAIPESLFESELFGHERGAFTGAHASRIGWFEKAQGGTLFLDEVGELPLAVQAKLLRALQDRSVMRLGGGREIPVDVRVVVATHRNLQEDAEAGRFRLDLYYRLHVVPIRLPALRERPEDVKVLTLHFLNRANQAHQRNVCLADDAWPWLAAQTWPGNIRELANLVERVVLLAPGDRVDARELGHWTASSPSLSTPRQAPAKPDAIGVPAEPDFRSVRDYRRRDSHSLDTLKGALSQAGGNQSRAAHLLGLTPRQFNYRWRQLSPSSM